MTDQACALFWPLVALLLASTTKQGRLRASEAQIQPKIREQKCNVTACDRFSFSGHQQDDRARTQRANREWPLMAKKRRKWPVSFRASKERYYLTFRHYRRSQMHRTGGIGLIAGGTLVRLQLI
jgi:hypothetical protein